MGNAMKGQKGKGEQRQKREEGKGGEGSGSHNKGKNSKEGKGKNRKEENEHETRREMRLGQRMKKEDVYQSAPNWSSCKTKHPQEYFTGTEGLSSRSCASKGQGAASAGTQGRAACVSQRARPATRTSPPQRALRRLHGRMDPELLPLVGSDVILHFQRLRRSEVHPGECALQSWPRTSLSAAVQQPVRVSFPFNPNNVALQRPQVQKKHPWAALPRDVSSKAWRCCRKTQGLELAKEPSPGSAPSGPARHRALTDGLGVPGTGTGSDIPLMKWYIRAASCSLLDPPE